ncbi:eCIS core domain-containing protein [Algoriphagus aquimarinus]|uniref:eCIS core domain-containing protein n=1 Tax=Algoriphagus aquimarinus TaxID=237018 RepID=UPI0030DC36FB|tara:strand:- start:383947 stop:387747 length:3801 start_codon:yes stop_codon:yes gene_type:complete
MSAVAERKPLPMPSRSGRSRRYVVQPSLKIGRPGDKYEQEAESVANHVVMSPSNAAPAMAMSPAPSSESTFQMQAEEEEETLQMMPFTESNAILRLSSMEEEEETIQLSPDSSKTIQRQEEEEETIQLSADGVPTASPQISSQISQSKGSGQSLPAPVQTEMGQKIGADFSGVNIHTGSQAAGMSNALGAQAFTHGNDIYFNEGKYQPETSDGKHLLAHELTHTVQQGAAPIQRMPIQSISSTEPQVQRLPWAAREGLARFASYIPGYSLLTVIIGYDPIAGRSVERNGPNLLGGLLGLIPIFGMLLFNKLTELGIINDAFTWVQGEMTSLNLTSNRLGDTLEEAWDRMGLAEGWDGNIRILDETFGQLYRDIVTFAGRVKDQIFTLIKDALMAGLRALADAFPGYPLLTKLLGHDPLTGEEVISTTAEKIEDFLRLIGKEDELERMQAEGTIQETADWIDGELAALNFSFDEVRGLFETAWNAFSLDDIRDPFGAFQRTVAIFTPFTTRVFTFAANVAIKVLEFIKTALLSMLSAYAREQQGFHLLTVILEKDPFTEEVVPRTTVNLIRGFMGLMPGGEAQFQQMQETSAIEHTVSRIDEAVATLNFSWPYITGLFLGLWNSFSIQDVFHPIDAFLRIVETLADPVRRLFAFVVTIVQILVEVILVVMNFPIETVQQIIANAQSAFADIKRDPIGFLRNLLGAVKQGFVQFFENILTHLLGGLRDWLFGELTSAGINPPADLTFESILGFVLDVLGLTMDNVWERLEMKLGPERVAQIRGAIDTLSGIWTFIKDVWERGPIAIWEYVQDQLSNLWTMVLEQVQSWVVTQIITQVTTRLLSLLDPTGIMAVVNSFIAFYRAIQSFIEKLREMLEIVNSFVAGVANIARGNIADAANYLENALARAIPIAIGFLANQVGLRGLGARIAEMIGGLRDRVNAAIDWLIDRAIAAGGALLEMGRNAVAWLTSWGRSDATFQEENGESHRIYVDPDQSRPQLMVASNPTTILEFLTFWESRPNISPSKTRKIAEARTHYNSVILPIITSIQESEQREEPETAREPLLANLLRQNSFLSLLLREIIGSRTNLADVTERYALESTVGRYSEMAGAVGDQFEADHQPQNSVLEYAADKDCFASAVNLRRRATNRSALAWTINVHELRHRAGRTYGRSPSSTFTGAVDRIDNSTLETTEKRRQIVEEIKSELALDATQMENVANRPVGDAVWNDLRDPNLGLDSDEQEEFRTEIKTRILTGERQIKNQPMDNLVN